jgi:hypothetical protein
MVYPGQVKKGTVVLDASQAVPNGSEVAVRVQRDSARRTGKGHERNPTLLERFRHIVGIVDDLPPDFSENHDHYLYGTPKRK